MATTALATTLNDQIRGLTSLSRERQIALLVVAAAAIAVIVSLVFWLTRTEYSTLFPELSERDSAAVVEALERNGVPVRLDPATGAVQVPLGRVHDARLKLATEGLPKQSGFGFELLEIDTGLGTSRAVEDARLQRVIEGELARSIMTLDAVENARVHLAMPRQSVFIRDRMPPSASVVLTLQPGRSLDKRRVAGIVHLVSSSITDLDPERVTVVDQRGRLLTDTPDDELEGLATTAQQLEFTRRVEENLSRRVVDLLTPLVGAEGVRAQVAADLDFSRIERTHEAFDPLTTALRSEQAEEEETRGLGQQVIGGVPGALTNQPPEGGVIDPMTEEAALVGPNIPASFNRRSVRNFEVDRTISHIREATGTVRRISVAVLVDDRVTVGEDGALVRVPLQAEEVERLTTLVREAVGFNAARGDSVNVINASFRPPIDPAAPDLALWQQPWVIDLSKTILIGLFILVVLLTVVRPFLLGLVQRGVEERQALEMQERLALGLDRPEGEGVVESEGAEGTEDGEGKLGEGLDEGQVIGEDGLPVVNALSGPNDRQQRFEESLAAVRELVLDDPRRAAQLMKIWIVGDGGND